MACGFSGGWLLGISPERIVYFHNLRGCDSPKPTIRNCSQNSTTVPPELGDKSQTTVPDVFWVNMMDLGSDTLTAQNEVLQSKLCFRPQNWLGRVTPCPKCNTRNQSSLWNNETFIPFLVVFWRDGWNQHIWPEVSLPCSSYPPSINDHQSRAA